MMRLLHTADWHLGRTFHGESLLDAHAAVIDHLVALARDAKVDAVVVAGDVYDRALPPVDAIRLASQALERLSEICPVIVISGNHDSIDRLGFGARMFDRAGLHVRTRVADVGCAIPVADGVVYPVPYLEPDVVRAELGVQERSHGAVLEAAMDRVRADLHHRSPQTPSAVVAHAFVTGAAVSDSERDLTVGGSASVAASVFDGVDYLALGHLHGPQSVGDLGRYAGSPVALSFSEARHAKSTAIVEVLGLGSTVELVPCPVPRALATLRGTLDELLRAPELEIHEDAWVQATITDAVQPPETMARLRSRFPHAVSLQFDPQGARPLEEGSYAERLEGLSDRELVERFVQDVRGTVASEAESDLLDRAFAERRAAEVRA